MDSDNCTVLSIVKRHSHKTVFTNHSALPLGQTGPHLERRSYALKNNNLLVTTTGEWIMKSVPTHSTRQRCP